MKMQPYRDLHEGPGRPQAIPAAPIVVLGRRSVLTSNIASRRARGVVVTAEESDEVHLNGTGRRQEWFTER